jgi:hypothetical protein
MPLEEKAANLMKTVPTLLSNNNVAMLSNPSSSGKKAVAEAKKHLGELTTNMKFRAASLAAGQKHMSEIPTLPMEDQAPRMKIVEDLLRQLRGTQAMIVKNMQALDKAVPIIKKEYGIP